MLFSEWRNREFRGHRNQNFLRCPTMARRHLQCFLKNSLRGFYNSVVASFWVLEKREEYKKSWKFQNFSLHYYQLFWKYKRNRKYGIVNRAMYHEAVCKLGNFCKPIITTLNHYRFWRIRSIYVTKEESSSWTCWTLSLNSNIGPACQTWIAFL